MVDTNLKIPSSMAAFRSRKQPTMSHSSILEFKTQRCKFLQGKGYIATI